MDLVEAFATMEPLSDAPEQAAANRARAEAAAVVLEAMRRLGPRIRAACSASDGAVEDAIQTVLLRILRRPAADRARLTTDAQVEAYLYRGIQNAVIDQHRRKPERSLEGAEERPELADRKSLDPPTLAAEHEAPTPADTLDRLLALLRGTVLEQATRRMRREAADDLREDLSQLLRIAYGEATARGLAEAAARSRQDAGAGSGEEAAVRQARNRIYQRHTRARRRLLEAVQALEREDGLTASDAEALRRLLEALRR